jgi:hypothetical protein
LSNDAAVRVFLGAQGFAEPRPAGRVDARHFAKLMKRLRILQLDSVNVVTRAHYFPAFSRLGVYDRMAFDRWIYDDANLFEYWFHEQSLAPMSFQPMMRKRMDAMVDNTWRRFNELQVEEPHYVDSVLEEIRDRGPITSRDLSDPGEKTGPWWGYGKGKIALDWLFMTGNICVARRHNFTRYFDLPERVMDSSALAASTPAPEAADEARILEAVHALGIGTVGDLADFFRMRKTETGKIVERLVEQRSLVEVEVAEWGQPAFVLPDVSVPRSRRGTGLVSMFDTLVWDRARTERMLGFRYRIEIYTPKLKRVYGYYVLPFLVDGELVGRVDVKADRKASVLRVPGVFAQDGVDVTHVGRELAVELRTMAEWLDLDDVEVIKNGNLAPATRSAL